MAAKNSAARYRARSPPGDFHLYQEFLFRTRFGAFFLYSSYEEEYGGEDDYEKIKPLTPEEARKWLEEKQSYDPSLIERLFGEMPEAGSGETKFTLRMPDVLAERLAQLAKENGQSLNAWAVRCLEGCAAASSRERSPQGQALTRGTE